jgi:cell wall-associated NlpC family hydrolase
VVEYSWHTVRRGENLTTIARAHGVTIGALKRGNHLSSDRLRAGQRLRVPGQLPGAQASAAAIITEEEVAVLSDSIRSVIRGFSPGVRSPFTQGGAGSVRADGNPLLAKLVDIAKSLLGIRYRRGGASTSGFDCSGFVQYVYDCFSLPLPHSAAQQFGLGDPIGLSELSIGDLLFFKTRRRPFPSHVGIYIGDNQFIHASSGKRRVTITSLDDPYYSKRFVGARRVAGDPLPGNETSELVPGEEPTTSQFLRLRSPHRRPAADPSPSRG